MRWLPTVVLCLSLAGCQCFARITVSGSLSQGVVFQAPADMSERLGGSKLYGLVVTSADAPDESPIWQLDGVAQVEAIRYGVVPPGMKESGRAGLLEPGRTYIVSIQGGSYFSNPGSACRGRQHFRVGADGTIVPCGREGSACG